MRAREIRLQLDRFAVFGFGSVVMLEAVLHLRGGEVDPRRIRCRLLQLLHNFVRALSVKLRDLVQNLVIAGIVMEQRFASFGCERKLARAAVCAHELDPDHAFHLAVGGARIFRREQPDRLFALTQLCFAQSKQDRRIRDFRIDL